MARSLEDVLALARLARKVLDAVQASGAHLALPPEAQQAMASFYDLSDYHGIAPDSAPHLPDGGASL